MLAASALASGCATTPYPSGPASMWVNMGVGYQSVMNGFGPRDTAVFSIERTWESGHFVKFEHISHLSAGEINSDPEDTLDHIVVGWRFCSSGACRKN